MNSYKTPKLNLLEADMCYKALSEYRKSLLPHCRPLADGSMDFDLRIIDSAISKFKKSISDVDSELPDSSFLSD